MPTHAGKVILVVDMQNEWIMPGSPVSVSGAYRTLPAIARFLDFGRANGWAVIYVCRHHLPSGIDAEPFRRHFFDEGSPIGIPGTWASDIPDTIAPHKGDIIIGKQRFSAFFGTRLDIILRGLGATDIYITGTQYPNCIRATAVDAISYNYNTTIVTDCCSAATEDIAMSNIRDLRNMGIPCVSSAELMR